MAKVLLATLYWPRPGFQAAPPLDLLYQAAVLRDAGHEVRVLDLRVRREAVDAHLDSITNFLPDVIAFSLSLDDAPALPWAAEQLKANVPRSLIVVTGPYAHAAVLPLLRQPGVNAVVRGEAEHVLPLLVSAWLRDGNLPELPGVGYPGRTLGLDPVPVPDLDALPLPAWDLVELELYHAAPRPGVVYKKRRFFPILTSRGCPYGCNYCLHMHGPRHRARSAESVVNEIEQLVWKYKIEEIHIIDDCFHLDTQRAKRICDLIVERKLNVVINLPTGLRADRMDRELIDKLAQAGCYQIAYAIDSAASRIQETMRQHVNFAKLNMVINYTVSRGIIATGFFLCGFPDETEDEVAATVDFALKSRLTLAALDTVTVLPGTALWELAAARGLTQDYDSARAAGAAPVYLASVPRAVLKKTLRQARRRFYLRPARLWRLWRALPNKGQFVALLRLFVGGAVRLRPHPGER